MEDLRQPAAQSRARGVDAACCCWAGRVLSPAWFWTLAVIGIILIPPLICLASGALPEAERRAAAPASRRVRRARPAGTSPRRPLRSRACRTRRSSAWMRSCARPGGCWSRASGCWNGIRRATRTARAARALPPILPVDVDRPRRLPRPRRCHLALSRPPRWPWPARYCSSGSPPPPSPGGSAGRCRAAPRRLTADQTRFSPEAVAQDLGVLRDLRRRRKITGCRRTTIRSIRCRGRASHVADQHGTGAAGESVRVRLRLHPGRTTDRAHRRMHSTRWQPWNGTGATSTTGTTRSP